MENKNKKKSWIPAIIFFVSIALVVITNLFKFTYDLGFEFGKVSIGYKPQEVTMIEILNIQRERVGLHKLTENGLLDLSARNKACDMGNKSYFSHVSPDGKQPWEFINDVGYLYNHAGENISKNNDVEKAMAEFMNSQEHKDNILNSNYTEVGIGICGEYLVQHFGSLR